MTPQRWRRIEDLYHAALEEDSGTRPAFLASQCGSDDDLRQEVESLLAQRSPGRILEESLGSVAAKVLPPENRFAAGSMIGPYKIVEQLGAGAMGEVYLADDTRLGWTPRRTHHSTATVSSTCTTCPFGLR